MLYFAQGELRVMKSFLILSQTETRFWHSPFSKELRDRRQDHILDRCRRRARNHGLTEYAVFDAFETLVAWGTIAE